jgi:hypothetical protein
MQEGIMRTRKLGVNPSRRLDVGGAVLAAARVTDIEVVKARLAAFANAHRKFVEAQDQVEAAEAQVREGQVGLARRDAEQDEAVEGLAAALVSRGQPRSNPFAAFGTAAPWTVKKMKPEAQARAIYQLVIAVQGEKPVGKAVLAAAAAAEQAARKAEAAFTALKKLQQKLADTRRVRDTAGQAWDRSLAALKRGARAAADDGAPSLYAALFGQLTRPAKKAAKPAPAPPAPVVAPVEPVPGTASAA